MAFIPALDTAEVSMIFTQPDGSNAENTFYVKRTSAWSSSELTTIANAFITWFGTGDGTHSYKVNVASTFSLSNVIARDLTTDTSSIISTNSGLPIAGTDSAAAAQMGETFAITARSGLSGRSNRGRTFVVGLPEDAFATGILNTIKSTFANSLVSAFNALLTAVPAADAACEVVILSRYHGIDSGGKPIPRATGVMTPVSVYGYSNLLMDFQRRRAPGHNRHH
jgi:hypothetical protein